MADRAVLVADDDADVRELLRTVLEGDGFQVIEARSAAEVFERLDEHRPEVLLLDVHLGPDDGIALGVGLQRDDRYGDLNVLFMTGTADDPDLVRLSEVWKVPILAKPFDFAALAKAIG